MKIILLKDHHRGDEFFRAGEEIDVSEQEYEFIMKYYMDERKVQVQKNQVAKEFLQKIGKVEK